MRIAVRNQLSLLLVLSSAVGLATLALATWFTNHAFVLKVARDGLEAAASLKAAELAVSLDLMYTSCLYLTTNTPLQRALMRYNDGSNSTTDNWTEAAEDVSAAVSSIGSLRRAPAVQAQLRATRTSGPVGTESVLNVTGAGNLEISLPWQDEDGTQARLGQGSRGYPPSLYPNLTVSQPQGDPSSASYLASYHGETLGLRSNLVLGPLIINESFSLMSMTLPVIENNSETNILGWLTIVQDARLIETVIQDDTGLGRTGQTLVLGPVDPTNLFPPGSSEQSNVRFMLPIGHAAANRHASAIVNEPFPASAFPAVKAAILDGFHGTRELGSMLNTHNENGTKVSVAYSTPSTTLVDWIVVVERTVGDVWEPIDHLRTVVLACLFSILGFFFLASFPIAHFAVRPIARLKAATESTINPLYGGSNSSNRSLNGEAEGPVQPSNAGTARKTGFFISIMRWRGRKRTTNNLEGQYRHEKRYRIPSKVDPPKRWKSEISDLMETFNEMSDQLFLQYSRLEERVQQRTAELDQSKKAAEAANESKTMFVANVSHELKTPLNGILGMCATSIEEDDVQQVKTSLGIIYKSGDLLLRILNDLLTFSTNQVGSKELMLEEREFLLQDLESQIIAIFEKTALDKDIELRVHFEEASASAIGTPARLCDMTLWGDVHRILQIVVNLVSNSLKYTPANGSVTFVIRRSNDPAPRRPLLGWEAASVQSQKSRASAVRKAHVGTANFINPAEGPQLQERSMAPPGNDLYIEFEVQDTGQGIPEDMQGRIFEPFVQGDVGLNRRSSGTGLGLSICSQLATLMKGTISLKSTVGVGSTFTIKLPLRNVMATPTTKTSYDVARTVSRPTSYADVDSGKKTDSDLGTSRESMTTQLSPDNNQRSVPVAVTLSPKPKEEAPKAPPSSTPLPSTSPEQADSPPKAVRKTRQESKDSKPAEQHDFSRIRILAAEDNKVNQQVILRMLKMEQMLQVTIAENGQHALDLVTTLHGPEFADAPPYDLIFMDIQMPIMDGLTSARLIRESGFKGPIVALTAFSEQSNIDECYQSGMDHFLAKPLKKPQLHEVLIKFCANKVQPVAP